PPCLKHSAIHRLCHIKVLWLSSITLFPLLYLSLLIDFQALILYIMVLHQSTSTSTYYLTDHNCLAFFDSHSAPASVSFDFLIPLAPPTPTGHVRKEDLGPWSTTRAYIQACAEREIWGVVRENEGKAAPHRLHLDPDEIQASWHHHLTAVPGDVAMIVTNGILKRARKSGTTGTGLAI
ncbi:hypothetical protein BJV78DRAFT_1304193, partial [Lactifluus subvellereus]